MPFEIVSWIHCHLVSFVCMPLGKPVQKEKTENQNSVLESAVFSFSGSNCPKYLLLLTKIT